MSEAKEFVRKLNIISINKDKETENEPEKEVTVVSCSFINHFLRSKK